MPHQELWYSIIIVVVVSVCWGIGMFIVSLFEARMPRMKCTHCNGTGYLPDDVAEEVRRKASIEATEAYLKKLKGKNKL